MSAAARQRWSVLKMIFHIHKSLRAISGPNAVLYAYPISPIADKIIDIDNSNIQSEESLKMGWNDFV